MDSTMARARRHVTRIAAVGAMALILSGLVAGAADARPRYVAVATANGDIDVCFQQGGDPSAYDYGSSIGVACVFSDGSMWEEYENYD